MAISKTVVIDGNPVEFRASALTLSIYKDMFGRDLLVDMNKIMTDMQGQNDIASMLNTKTLRIFADAAYVMYMSAHSDQKHESADEWLDQFSMFSIYEIFPALIDLWGLNTKTTVPARKNAGKQSGQ